MLSQIQVMPFNALRVTFADYVRLSLQARLIQRPAIGHPYHPWPAPRCFTQNAVSNVRSSLKADLPFPTAFCSELPPVVSPILPYDDSVQIRLYLFSDLRRGEDELLQENHKNRRIIETWGLLSFMKRNKLIIALGG